MIGLGISIVSQLRFGGIDAYAVAGFNPALVSDFEAEYYRTGGTVTTFESAMTTTRASSATMVNSSGNLVTVEINVPRRGQHVWDGAAWVNRGMLIEPTAATNLLLNNATLSTQSVTVTAVPHTLHFTGTGTVTLSGAATGSLVGAGAGEQNRVNLTFTPTAGSLTLTVTGSVTFADLTATPIPYSHIPTAGATVTRAADIVTIPAANLPYPAPVFIGPELIVNGGFDTDTDWTKDAGWTISGGVASVALTGINNKSLIQGMAGLFTVGSVYLLQFDYSVTAGRIRQQQPFSVSGSFFGAGESGTCREIFVATGTNSQLGFQAFDGDTVGTIDNVSFKEISPLRLSIQLSGRQTGDSNTFLEWEEDAQFGIRMQSGLSDFSFTQEAFAVEEVVTGGSFTSGVNVPFNVAARHGSLEFNGAVDGTSLTVDTVTKGIPYLEFADLTLSSSGGPIILKTLRMWPNDLGDAGIAEASA
jgi:hypothetical protein